MTGASGPEQPALAMEAALAEHGALRGEMAWLIEHGARLQNYALGLTVALFPAAAYVLDRKRPAFLAGLLVTASVVHCLLGLLYLREHEEVGTIADYLRNRVRPVVVGLTGREDLWTWEDFKPALPRTVLVLRLGVFALPAVAASALAVAVAVVEGREELVRTFTEVGAIVLLVLAVVDAAALVLLVVQASGSGHRLPPGERQTVPGAARVRGGT